MIRIHFNTQSKPNSIIYDLNIPEIRHTNQVATSSSNGLVLSPQRQTFTYEQHDTRLPPDLLPYGPQALSLQNSTAAILEHKNRQYIGAPFETTATAVSIPAPANGSTQDLRIYHPLSNGCLASSSSTKPLASTTIYPPLPPTRTNYDHSTTNSIQGNAKPASNIPQPPSFHSIHSTNSTKLIDNGCKPRQSIVRTSPSFSFLSTGYQQQDNFL